MVLYLEDTLFDCLNSIVKFGADLWLHRIVRL